MEVKGVHERLLILFLMGAVDHEGARPVDRRACVSAAAAIWALTLRRSMRAAWDFFNVFLTKLVMTTLHCMSTSSRM